MATIKKFEDLEIWKEARDLSKEIFLITNQEGLKLEYKLKEQIKSSAGSVMDNIAEGFERDGNLEFRHFYLLQKVPRLKLDLSYIEFLIMGILIRKN